MTDPSGLRVIEALCPSVSRYAMRRHPGLFQTPYDKYSFSEGVNPDRELTEEGQSQLLADHLRACLERAITEMRTYEERGELDSPQIPVGVENWRSDESRRT